MKSDFFCRAFIGAIQWPSSAAATSLKQARNLGKLSGESQEIHLYWSVSAVFSSTVQKGSQRRRRGAHRMGPPRTPDLPDSALLSSCCSTIRNQYRPKRLRQRFKRR